MGEAEFNFDALERMEIEELKKMLEGHPDQIEGIAQKLLKERSTPFLPLLTRKVLRALTHEEDFLLPKVAALFAVLQLNHFLGLDRDQMLTDALVEGNLPLAHQLFESGASVKRGISEKKVCETLTTLCFTPHTSLYYHLLFWMEKHHPHELSFQNPLFLPIYRKLSRDPSLCNVTLRVSDGQKEESLRANKEVLSIESRTLRGLFSELREGDLPPLHVETIPSFSLFIRTISGEKINWSQEVLQDLFLLSHAFSAPSLQKACEEELFQEKRLKGEDLVFLYALAKKCGSASLENRLLFHALLLSCKGKPRESLVRFLETEGKGLRVLNLEQIPSKVSAGLLLERAALYCPLIERCTLSAKMRENELWLLSRFEHLSHLDLGGFWVSPSAFSLLASLPGVTYLSLCNQCLTEKIGVMIAAWKRLRTLNLTGCSFERNSLQMIGRCTGLEKLILTGAIGLSEEQIASLKRQLPKTQVILT